MILTQSAATSRIYAAKHYEKVDENIDLYGLSAANVAAALSGGFVVNGSPTQTAMMEDAGGRSQMAQVTTAVVVGVVLLFLTGPLQYLPTCVLGVLVFLVALRLIDFAELKNIRSESPQEFALAVMTARSWFWWEWKRGSCWRCWCRWRASSGTIITRIAACCRQTRTEAGD
jgi:sulfate permease, SulP family